MISIKISKRIIKILAITSIISSFSISSYAENKYITIDSSFTYEDGYWKPGRIESKSFYINNHKSNKISIDRLYLDLKSSEYWKTGEKLDINSKQFKEFAKYSTVTLKHDDDVLFKDTFKNLLSKDGIILSKDININANDNELLNMTIDMDLEMNNDAQALNNVFTIGVAYTQDDTNPDGGEDGTNPDGGGDGSSPDGQENGIDSDNLPQTGGIINSTSLVALGVVAIGTGAVLNKKSKKGDEHSE